MNKIPKTTARTSIFLAPPVELHHRGSAMVKRRQLAGHISHRYRPECGNCGLGSVTLFVDLQVGWRDVGKDAAQRVQPTCLTGCKAAHRTSLAAVIETITECATTNN